MKDKDDIKYYHQILIEQCVYSVFSNNKLIHSDLDFTETKPDDNDESEEEINENTVFDDLKNLNNSNILINKKPNIIVCINYALLSFYLCHFERYECIKRLNCV